MLEQEILEVVRGSGDKGDRLNEIADQFRGGRNVKDIVDLLDSTHPELASIGAWILGELPIELYSCDLLVSRLQNLIGHEDPTVRFHAFGALFPILGPEHASTRDLVEKLRNDPNEGVRRIAEAAAARLM